ncbi:MauE/DoxX family redox-associated membrane protein [Porphyrobacter sp. CACIAM 03H1]|jgi:uncharacterized membrane protein YphA (DoxX/SURF4 family)|uniref:MauE/DoxX family redox-associated membrane protein n=1 Tax=Porphyrobacter sp. CACIAM 03H1 TaxID=2003315 RepID=UPI000B5A7706|nr:MauE/DoxX family redox-associated membrane protein [Porphyrobacter sp. CACIAM 03H1]ASJ90271.1 hypothetical protein CBR61_04580 [Porphyrobacter sp. CACIAM 03H1]
MLDDALLHAPSLAIAGLRAIIGMIFLSAGVSKLLRRTSLERMMHLHGLRHPLVVALAAGGLATAEILIGLVMLLGWTREMVAIGALAAVALLLLFGALAGRLAQRGQPFECRCSPLLASHTSGTAVAIRNLVLAGAALAIVGSGPVSDGSMAWTRL